ncbi:DgyrCDS10462 [Dimorphilus gyrociliatus]|nr:DgyrCDS10462 [Dimorphilus gyrociliatus]
MRKLEEIASAEEKKLEQAEQYLEEDAQMFDAFLKENDTNSVNAIQKAEAETKKKLEKLSEIKRVTAQMMTIKSEISKHEETLKEYQMYKRFLESLTPPEWLELRALDRKKRVEAKRKEAAADQQERASTASSRPSSKASRQNVGSRESRRRGRGGKTSASSRRNLPAVQGEDQDTNLSLTDEDSDEEPELYFTDPQQLLDIFADLEEQNLSLIQNSQETEETLEDMKQNLARTQKNMEKETKVLQDQINKLESAIEKEDVKANDLKMKAKMFNYGEFKSEDQENMLKDLKAKVEEVYRSTIGDNEANIETLQMLTNIENRLEELFELMETLPRDKVEEAEKKKEKERRLKAREDKMEQQKKHQEERVQKALQRAQAAPKKQVGRRVMGRSEPPAHKQTDDDKDNQQSKEDEELAYYFT